MIEVVYTSLLCLAALGFLLYRSYKLLRFGCKKGHGCGCAVTKKTSVLQRSHQMGRSRYLSRLGVLMPALFCFLCTEVLLPSRLSRCLGVWMLALFCSLLEAQPLPLHLSKDAKVSLLTTGPSRIEIAAAFGHSGVRIQDVQQDIDILFNYGVFNFQASGFFINYIRGEMNYQMGLFDSKRYIAHVNEEGRSLLSQELNLSYEQKQSIYRYLIDNYAPERRTFAYDYFYRNCATQIRDLLEQQLPDLVIDSSYVASDEVLTLRLLMNKQMSYFPWLSLGINMLVGSEIDRPLGARAYMFLPKYVAEGLRTTQLNPKDSTQLFVKKETLLLPDQQTEGMPLDTPLVSLFVLLAIVFFITYKDYRYERSRRWIDISALFFVGFMGLLMTWMWVATRHHSAWNYHLIWAWPMHFFVPLFIHVPRLKMFLRVYLKIYGTALLLLLLAWDLLPQEMPSEMFPLWILLLLRVVHYFQHPQKSRSGSRQVQQSDLLR